MLKKVKQFSDSAISKISQGLPRFNPNFITIAGVLPPVLFFWLVTHNYFGWALLALAGTALDSIDGGYARATGQETKFGAFLDSCLDRLTDAIMISAFGFAELISWELIIAIIICSFLISYIRSAGLFIAHDSKLLAVGPIERAQRLGLIFIGLGAYTMFPEIRWLELNLLQITFVVLFALSILTVFNRIDKVRQLS